MSKKVGVITIHSVYNYGAMLQAFALSKYIESKGYISEVIDYRPYELCRNYDFYLKDLFVNPRNALGAIKQSIVKRKQFTRFKSFLNAEISKSKKRYGSYGSLKNHDYDILVTGSDQIWNPYITVEDESFLLTFDDKGTKKVAYSSSFGVSEIPDLWAEKVKSALKEFKQLGVREQSGKKIINGLLPDKNVDLVLDPVFLMPKNYWCNLADDSLTPNEPYLLVYSLEINDKIKSYAKALAKENKLKIVTIHPFKGDYEFADICVNTAGPKEFISLINNADFVVTNSFHGTAFSILLEKKFSCVLHSKTGTRMSGLLERLHMEPKALPLSSTTFDIPYYEVTYQSQTALVKHIENSKNALSLENY
ncbi:polysaccharide pyruvyl transferase family protein [Vibrio vulnificus]|uniref:polysaccharide pyruvyl transferase family protein n=1 Tax=Vibrio vulnificus TaxID=672 RepID=UPI0010234AF8|nr:polysaccharide pyruvyl transferase family protein [Vibrio vulnificus]EIH0731314.1 polysaccharide pyruvyl transferase family protein [Vibrio vulnificus]EIH1436762.1 polysaccharide pyruvyl transferase family protein [Vibrio vulnificus]EKZ9201516.1 polysaccharide pyruvyl transferase family protein [Vibrio vulnificus]MBN8111300.1 polysaccharide pyruvyl transferase family protein [Vibrio vulnificus]MCA3975285.1 polysaccharide pyruvyl transferase family protein [Vibrio vulnificus]